MCFIVHTHLLNNLCLWCLFSVLLPFDCFKDIFKLIFSTQPYLLFCTNSMTFLHVLGSPCTNPSTADNIQTVVKVDIHEYGICVYFYFLVDFRQVSVVSVPVAFRVEPVLSFVVRVGSLLKPPAEF